MLLAPAAEAGGSPRKPLICFGQEPYWNLTIDNEQADYRSLSMGKYVLKLTGKVKPLDYMKPPMTFWRGRGKGLDGDLVAFITQERCADTMADQVYRYKISVSLPDGGALTGCCR